MAKVPQPAQKVTASERFHGVPGNGYAQGFDLRLVPEKLAEPLRRARPKMIFVNSISVLFHDDYVAAFTRVVQLANWQTSQVLTGRSEGMRDLVQTRLRNVAREPQVCWGVSVENRMHGPPRMEHLRQLAARIRFLSIEPLLQHLGPRDLEGIACVIVAGESSVGARQMDERWVSSIRDHCRAAHVPFFLKQWGGSRKKWRVPRLFPGGIL